MKPEKQTTKALKTKANKLMSELVRRKHADHRGMARCFTCNALKPWRELQAGHGIGGRGNFVLFLEEVIKPQCSKCNVLLKGNYEVFVIKLTELYGLQTYQEWVIESRKPFKRTKGDYIELVYELQDRLEDLRAKESESADVIDIDTIERMMK